MSDSYGSAFLAWGKLSGSVAHPLTAHMLDVAACFYAISKIESVKRSLERLAKRTLNDP